MEKHLIINIRFSWLHSVLCYWKWGKFCVPRQTNTDTIEHHFGNSRQSVGGGNAPTAMQKRTNDACSSIYNTTTGPTKGNNASAPTYDDKLKNISEMK